MLTLDGKGAWANGRWSVLMDVLPPKNRYFVSIEVFYSKSVFYSATVLELYNEDLGNITALFYKMQF
jgi:hypothetical protein